VEVTGVLQRARSMTGKSRFGATRQLTGNRLNSVELRHLSANLGMDDDEKRENGDGDDGENNGYDEGTDASTSEYTTEDQSTNYDDENPEYVEQTEEDASENPEESETNYNSEEEDPDGEQQEYDEEQQEEYEEYSGDGENIEGEEGYDHGEENYFNAYANAHRDLIDGVNQPPVQFLDTETSPYDHLESILVHEDPTTLFSDLIQIGKGYASS
jgi:hypothetical protein